MIDEDFILEEDEGFIKAYLIQNNQKEISALFSKDSVNPLEDFYKIKIKEFIYLEELYVYPEFRRQGYGTKLMEKFLLELNDEETPIVLIAGSDKTPKSMDIVNFYENFGFEILFNEDQVVMIR